MSEFWRRLLTAAAIMAAVGAVIISGAVRIRAQSSAGGPLPGLTEAELAQFFDGQAVFTRVFTPDTGLGPLFNSVSCATCHAAPAVGGFGLQQPGGDDVEVHATKVTPAGCDDLTALGGPVFQLHAVPPAVVASIPADAQMGRRTTPAVFGFGLLEAIPDDTLVALQAQTGGRVHRLPDGRIGRFGRKAQIATLTEFTTGAFSAEQGLDMPQEVSAADSDLTTDFVRFLAPLPGFLNGEGLSRQAAAGAVVFNAIGCSTCHVAVLTTGSHPVAALSEQRVALWSDLLLHDMGPGLADLCLGDARPEEWRTPPLAGLGVRMRFLHDGRALTLESAITQHGGQGQASADAFIRLGRAARAALLAFLRAL